MKLFHKPLLAAGLIALAGIGFWEQEMHLP